MKKILMLLILCLHLCTLNVRANHTMFVGVTEGIPLRADKNAQSTIIAKINYGEQVIVDSQLNKVISNGFDTYWAAIRYNGQQGYVLYANLIPIPPPRNISELENYAEQLSTKACQPIINIDGDTSTGFVVTDKKTLYENGFIYTVYNNYEYMSESLTIPGISIQQAYIIVQNIAYLKDFLPADGKFPDRTDSGKSANGDYRQTILQYYEHIDGNYKKLQKLQFIIDETDINGVLSIIELNQQIVIIIENGS